MDRENRAKQFMPFDALKGLKEELKHCEERRLRENKRELLDEEIEALTRALNSLKRGMRINITYYDFIKERYLTIDDVFTSLRRDTRFLITENHKIYWDDLLEVIILS